ncbi:MAG: hypothetical protein E6R13_06145 [Spirochaetes bacterium]|nr:MAG: hypothetical protein E6R13_06145 [Spirochaetota bacterium]
MINISVKELKQCLSNGVTFTKYDEGYDPKKGCIADIYNLQSKVAVDLRNTAIIKTIIEKQKEEVK